jgi:hypothetical protein
MFFANAMKRQTESQRGQIRITRSRATATRPYSSAAAMLATALREPVRKAHSGFAVLLVGLAPSTVVALWAVRYARDQRAATIVSRQPSSAARTLALEVLR